MAVNHFDPVVANMGLANMERRTHKGRGIFSQRGIYSWKPAKYFLKPTRIELPRITLENHGSDSPLVLSTIVLKKRP